MQQLRLFLLVALAATAINAAQDPTLYQYYTSGGIKSGLEASHSDHFTLNGKPFIIYGGSFHYFRVVPQYWRSTLLKFRAAGLNAVQIYLPWNLHEPVPGHFDFTSPLLQLAKFLEEIKDADMFAIVRPGPFICAEWELGGFPSWLLRDDHLQLRTNYKPYLERVKIFWDEAMKIINKYQFSKTGGPVIMLQIENEYSGRMQHPQSDEYLRYLRNVVLESGFKELLFASDPGDTAERFLIKGIFPHDSVLQTANLNHGAYKVLTQLKKHQPNKPAFVSEFWPGWYDEWHDKHHHTYSLKDYDQEISDILFKVNGSVNFYMFIGGTNFGFMNGDRVTTSYDYDAPLTESGNYTQKYHKTRELYLKLVSTGRYPKLHLPALPPHSNAAAYGKLPIHEKLPLEALLAHAKKFTKFQKPVTMELLPVGHDYGQSYGWVLYRVETQTPVKDFEITGTIFDRGIFLVDHQQVAIMEEGNNRHFKHHFDNHTHATKAHHHQYDVLVENLGRHKFGGLGERKGIASEIKVDGHVWRNTTIYSLDFDQTFVQSLKSSSWQHLTVQIGGHQAHPAPAMYRTTLKVSGAPADTYLKLDGWTKGSVFVNSFNIGRYWSVGPTRTLYVPGPLLRTGDNTIEVFELHKAGHDIEFIDKPILG